MTQQSQVVRDGKTVTTKRTVVNGQVTDERVETVDNASGKLLSLQVNGEHMPVSGSLQY